MNAEQEQVEEDDKGNNKTELIEVRDNLDPSDNFVLSVCESIFERYRCREQLCKTRIVFTTSKSGIDTHPNGLLMSSIYILLRRFLRNSSCGYLYDLTNRFLHGSSKHFG